MPSFLEVAGLLIKEEPRLTKLNAGTLEVHAVAQFCKQHNFQSATDFKRFLDKRKAAIIEERLALGCSLYEFVDHNRRQFQYAVEKLGFDRTIFKDPVSVINMFEGDLNAYIADITGKMVLDVLDGLGQSEDDLDAIISQNKTALECVFLNGLSRAAVLEHCLASKKTVRTLVNEGRCAAERKLTGGHLFADFFQRYGDLVRLFTQATSHEEVLTMCHDNHCTLLEIVERGQRHVQGELGIKDYGQFPNLLYTHEDILSLAREELGLITKEDTATPLSFLARIREYDCETFKDFLHFAETVICEKMGNSTPQEIAQLIEGNARFVQVLFGKSKPSVADVYRKMQELGEKSLASVIVKARVECLIVLLGEPSGSDDLLQLEGKLQQQLKANQELIHLSQIQTQDIFQLRDELQGTLDAFCQKQETRLLAYLLEEEEDNLEYLRQLWTECVETTYFAQKAIKADSLNMPDTPPALIAARFFRQHRLELSMFCEQERQRTITGLGFNTVEGLTLFVKQAQRILHYSDTMNGRKSLDYEDDLSDEQLDRMRAIYKYGLVEAVLGVAEEIIGSMSHLSQRNLWTILLNSTRRVPCELQPDQSNKQVGELRLSKQAKISLATEILAAADVFEVHHAVLAQKADQLCVFFKFAEKECALVDGLEEDKFTIQERVEMICDMADMELSKKLIDELGIQPAIEIDDAQAAIPNVPGSMVMNILRLASLVRHVRDVMQIDKPWLQVQHVVREYLCDPNTAGFVMKKLRKDTKEMKAE